jgi:hypothetical protein
LNVWKIKKRVRNNYTKITTQYLNKINFLIKDNGGKKITTMKIDDFTKGNFFGVEDVKKYPTIPFIITL